LHYLPIPLTPFPTREGGNGVQYCESGACGEYAEHGEGE
jgi:hypothetical protein